MNKKLTAHMMSKLVEGVKREYDENSNDIEIYMSVVSEKEAIVKADDDFTLGLALGVLLKGEVSLIDSLEFKFLSKVEMGKLYQLTISNDPVIEEMMVQEFGLDK